MLHKFLFSRKTNFTSFIFFLILFSFQLRFGIIPGFKHLNSDFPNYYTSSKLVMEKKSMDSLYHDSWFQNKIIATGINEKGKFSPFPPPTVLVMLPIVHFSPIYAKRIWTLINCVLFFVSIWIIKKIADCNFISAGNLLLLSGIALANNFYLGQVYLLVLVLVLAGYLYLKQGKPVSGSMLVAVATALKYFPVVYFLPFLKKRTVIWFALTLIALYGVSFFLIGRNAASDFVEGIFFQHLNGSLSSQSPYSWQFQSLNSLLLNIFVFHPAKNPYPLINVPVAFYIFKWVITALVVLPAALYINRLKAHKNFKEWCIIITSSSVFVLLPATSTYHLSFLVLALILLIKLSYNAGNEKLCLLPVIFFTCAGFIPFLLENIFEMQAIPVFLRYTRLYFVILFFAGVIGAARKVYPGTTY